MGCEINMKIKKDETMNAVDFIYNLEKNGFKDFFSRKDVYNAIKETMNIDLQEKINI